MSFSAKVTLATIQRLAPGDIVWDTQIKGFGARKRNDAVTYFFKKRMAGEQRWLTIGKHGSPWTPESARKHALTLSSAVAHGENPAAIKLRARNQPTFTAAAEMFFAEHGPKLKPRSLAEYRKLYRRYLVPAFGHRNITAISHQDVAAAHAKWATFPRAANHAVSVLSRMMTWAEEQQLRPRDSNACKRIIRYRENKRERYLTTVELKRLGAAIDRAETRGLISLYAAAAFRLLMLTGARSGEILTLKWEYVDLERGLLLLPDSKTGKKTIALSDPAAAILARLPRVRSNPYVIVGHCRGAHMIHLYKPWSIVCGLARLSNLRIHDLRHTFASVAVAAGASLPMIGKMLGHNHPQTTARYAHLADDPVRQLSRQTGALIAASAIR